MAQNSEEAKRIIVEKKLIDVAGELANKHGGEIELVTGLAILFESLSK